MSRMLCVITLLFFFLSCSSEENYTPKEGSKFVGKNTFISYSDGVKIIKPSSWEYIDKERILQEVQKLKWDDRDFEKAAKSGRYYSKVNIIKDIKNSNVYALCEYSTKDISRMKKRTEKEIWKNTLPGYQKAFRNFRLLKGPYRCKLSHKKVSSIEGTYLHQAVGLPDTPAHFRIFMWVKGKKMYRFSFAYPQSIDAESLEEIEQLISKFVIMK